MPLIVDVKAVLAGLERGRAARIGAGCEPDAVVRDFRVHEIVESAEIVVAVEVLNEEVLELEQLVVRADDDVVRAFDQREVVGHLDDVLVERVRAGEAFRSDLDGARARTAAADFNRREKHRRGACVLDELVRDARFVEVVRSKN